MFNWSWAGSCKLPTLTPLVAAYKTHSHKWPFMQLQLQTPFSHPEGIHLRNYKLSLYNNKRNTVNSPRELHRTIYLHTAKFNCSHFPRKRLRQLIEMNLWYWGLPLIPTYTFRAVTKRHGPRATKNVAPSYFDRKTEEKQNQKKSLAVWFPTCFLYLPENLKC